MKLIKKSKPEFYDCTCNKCKAEFIYQLEDIEEEEVELPEETQNFLTSIFTPTNISFVVCPCCNNKVRTSNGNGLNFMFGGNN